MDGSLNKTYKRSNITDQVRKREKIEENEDGEEKEVPAWRAENRALERDLSAKKRSRENTKQRAKILSGFIELGFLKEING